MTRKPAGRSSRSPQAVRSANNASSQSSLASSRTKWGVLESGHKDIVAHVRHDRIKIAVAAWAYEKGYRPIMSDAEYDALSQRVDRQRNVATGNHRLDRFFQRHFDANTGLWIHKHPDLSGIENIYARFYYPALYRKEIRRKERRARRNR